MGELFAEIGDLIFSLVIGYMSCIEFLYVVRHLYHYSCNHDPQAASENQGDNLSQLQDSLRRQLANAKDKEALAGTQVMKDGVPYKDGFRIESQQALIDQLKEQLKNKELSDLRRQELEKELAKQMKIAEQLRKELAEAEAKYARQLKQQAEEEAKKHREEQRKREEEEKAKKEAAEIAEKLKQKQKEAEERARQEAEENARKLAEAEKQREEEQKRQELEQEQARQKAEAERRKREEEEEQARARQEAEENAKRLMEAERQREEEQKRLELEQEQKAEAERRKLEAEEEQERARQEAEEAARKLLEAEKQREAEQRQREEEEERERERQEAEENARQLAELEKAREEQQARDEERQRRADAEAAAAQNLLEIEKRLEEQLRAAEQEAELTEKERQLIESIKKQNLPASEGTEQRDAELLRKILEAREQLGEESEEEQSLRLLERERDQEAKQKRIDENALLFLEAEKEMAELQAKMLDIVEKKEFTSGLDSAPQTPIVEAPCIKKAFSPLLGGESSPPSKAHTVKTQLAQDLDKPYSVSTKPLLFPGVSDDASSIDPASSQQSSFSTQPSEEITTGTESQYPQHERQEPDGEDTALSHQYSDDYLRSLDGIKSRPLVREDGSGRRRAFKKRRSSNSSNSSRESRHSRDEELKMFTSLEEEEMKDTADSDFTPIRYTSEPTLKVKGHHRRHKRSPAKDMRHSEESLRSSLERLGEEESSNPWGEVKPEHYKNTEFWKREKTLSIDEEMEFEKPPSSEEVSYDTATNMPSASSFEEATQIQNEEALTALSKQATKQDIKKVEHTDKDHTATEESARSDNTNLQTSQNAENEAASPARFSASPRLRRSPRLKEINQYEERWTETNLYSPNAASDVSTPSINVQTPLDFGPWRDQYGLLMEGISDFYDFTASVNPSRSRSTSRNPSPANTAPSTPLPKDVSFNLGTNNEEEFQNPMVEVYDDTENLENSEFKRENIIKFIDSLNGNEESKGVQDTDQILNSPENFIQPNIQLVADDPTKMPAESLTPLPMVNIITETDATNPQDNEFADDSMNSLVHSLRSQRSAKSRSRSKSPLPTPDNLQRSLENRRFKMIKHNEDILEKLIESKLLPELTPTEEPEQSNSNQQPTTSTPLEDNDPAQQTDTLAQSLHVDRNRGRSKSPMRLPTAENLSKGLEKRRSKLIERNDEFFKQLEERSQTPESPRITVEYVYEVESGKHESSQAAPTITVETSDIRPQASSSENEDEECSRENMELLVQSLRVAQSRSRSKSPMRPPPGTESIEQTAVHYTFQHTEQVEIQERTHHSNEYVNTPTISIEFAESESNASAKPDDEDCSREDMDKLIQSLRVAQSRSRSKSPMRLPTNESLNKSLDSNDELLQHMQERAKTPEPTSGLSVEYVYEFEHSDEVTETSSRSRHSRSKSPSRSHSVSPSHSIEDRDIYRSRTPSRSASPKSEHYNEFHIMLNLEGSENKTLIIKTEEQESLNIANRQRQLDEEALEKLKNASEETELRTLSPLVLDKDELNEQQGHDLLADLPITEKVKLLRKSPTTPEYDRTISEEMRDVERIKQERLEKGFKRSTYVGESMDLGSEFEPLRRETAHFERSRSPSPSFSFIDAKLAKQTAEENRKLQEQILQQLTAGSSQDSKETKSTGAIPKSDRRYSYEIELTLTNELDDTTRIKEEMVRSVEESVDKTIEYEEMRRKNAEFRRSGSASRSPLNEVQRKELAGIEKEAAKRELHDRMLDEVSCAPLNFQEFSRHLNTDFFDNDRRASDSALIRKPDILVSTQDLDHGYVDPDEYHHYRRFSLAQEEPVEEYPNDDYIYIEKVEVRTRSGSRTWLKEDFYSEEVDEFFAKNENDSESSVEREPPQDIEQPQNVQAVAEDDEEYSNNSDDDRQTVVEVDDEIDEDITDFNERGPAEESHHETSECEEAEREMDRYAGRAASDWNRIIDGEDILTNENPNKDNSNSEDEGAVGGLSNSPYDSDSFAIDQIYDEAIKNRKQSGILREYDSILMQMSSGSEIDEQYLLWSKTQSKKKPKNIEFNTQFIDNERKESEMRYLGDANVTARQSARLRSRYGYNPVLQAKCLEDDLEVDLNYKPKREYNWRKNFKLDEDSSKEDKEITIEEIKQKQHNEEYNTDDNKWEDFNGNTGIDLRKFSLGGESVTIFSQSPEKQVKPEEYVDMIDNNNEVEIKEEVKEEKPEKPKKKKTKKKLHKEAKSSLEESMNREDEEAYDSQMKTRRSSSIQMDTDSPKRKSRSRRSSKSSVTNEDTLGMFSPRNSVGYAEPITDIMEEYTDMVKETTRPKKMKKRKKVKETMANVRETPLECKESEENQYHIELLKEIPNVSAAVTPESSKSNILSTLSPQNSVCTTPMSIDLDASVDASVEELSENSKETTSSSTTTSSPSSNISRTSSITTPVDTFDILKDANFYPLF